MTKEELERHLPPGIHFVLDAEFVNQKTGRTMKLHDWHGSVWLFVKHPGGNWVSVREASPQERVSNGA